MADDGLKGVVVGTTGLDPVSLFKRTRETFQNVNHDPSTPRRKSHNTGVACPDCKEQGILLNPVMADDSGLRCSQGHKFVDTDALLERPHDTVPVEMPTIQQENWVSASFQLPAATLAAIQSKYGSDTGKMRATFAALAAVMIDGSSIIIGGADVKRLSDACGLPIRNGTELYGIVKGQQQQIEDLESAAKTAGPSQGTGGTMLRRGELILWFDPPTTSALTEKAKSAGVNLDAFLESYIGQANENSWF
jgi:hypothetical protein